MTTPAERARELRDSRKTLHLATIKDKLWPTASYAPFIKVGVDLCIYISENSQHTKNLLEQPYASVMLIEDEAGSENLLVRKRLTMFCEATIIARKSETWHLVMSSFKERFGNIFDLVRPLEDFILFWLHPLDALYVEGFGQAYRLSAELTTAEHIRDGGHRPEKSG